MVNKTWQWKVRAETLSYHYLWLSRIGLYSSLIFKSEERILRIKKCLYYQIDSLLYFFRWKKYRPFNITLYLWVLTSFFSANSTSLKHFTDGNTKNKNQNSRRVLGDERISISGNYTFQDMYYKIKPLKLKMATAAACSAVGIWPPWNQKTTVNGMTRAK